MKVDVSQSRARRESTPTCSSSASTRARSCPTSSPARRGAGDAKGAFKKLTAAPPRAARAACWSSGSASARSSTPSGAGRRGAGRQGGRQAGGDLARLGCCPSPTTTTAIAEGARHRHDPRRLPLRPLQEPRTPTSRRRRARVADPARRRRASPRRPRPPGSAPRPRTAPATCRACPPTSPPPPTSASRAEEIAAAHESVSVEVLGRERDRRQGMGGLVAVSQGGAEEPRLIVLRYAGGGSGATLGLVGKGVTFDTGGISIKPSAGHAGDEDGHVRRRRGARGGRGDRRARPADRPDRRRPLDREHALGHRDQARRHHHPVQRQDGRGQQHRRRGPADPRRRARLRGRARRRAGRRHRDPDRRRAGRARLDLRGGDLQRRRARRRGRARPARRPASWSGACPSTPSTRS